MRRTWLQALLLPLALSGCGTSAHSFSLSWKLVDAKQADPTTAPSLSCADAGVDTIRLTLQGLSDPTQPIRVDFPCPQMSGLTAPQHAGTYTIDAAALDKSGQPLSRLVFEESNAHGPRDLGLIIFQIQR